MWFKGQGTRANADLREPLNGEANMIHIVQDWNARQHTAHLDQMFRLRARVFKERHGWDVVCVDGKERDWLDDHSPVYVLATDAADVVVGACRLLPSTGPTLLEACFSDSMPDAAKLVDATIWECTRFCVDSGPADRCDERLGRATRSIVKAVCSLASRSGIETILANMDSKTLRMCQTTGFAVDVLGMTCRYGSPVYLGAFSIQQASSAVRARRPVRPAFSQASVGAQEPMLL